MLDKRNLSFVMGHDSFTADEFVELVQPYMADLTRVGRTNFLCAFVYGDGSKADVTGYRTNTTLHATINDRCLKADRTGGKWVVFTHCDIDMDEAATFTGKLPNCS